LLSIGHRDALDERGFDAEEIERTFPFTGAGLAVLQFDDLRFPGVARDEAPNAQTVKRREFLRDVDDLERVRRRSAKDERRQEQCGC